VLVLVLGLALALLLRPLQAFLKAWRRQGWQAQADPSGLS